MSSSVVVVEIDTRKGPVKTIFESSTKNQTEQAKQFWKTLSLAPHIESSLYSKEILQQIKPNTLKPMTIDNSKKPVEPDRKTEAYLHQLEVLNKMDEMAKTQKKIIKIEEIKKLHKTVREKSNQLSNISRTGLMKSESESKWVYQLNEVNESLKYNEVINENDYEFDANDVNFEEEVKNLDF